MKKYIKTVLNNENKDRAKDFFDSLVALGVDFKSQQQFRKKCIDAELLKSTIVTPLSREGIDLEEIKEEFVDKILPSCANFGSNNFMGFPDSGNSVAGIGGAIIADFLQQNLINQSFCSPSGTFIEIAVLQWLRSAVGYENVLEVNDVWDVGGIITPGGTSSNAIAMMLARENKAPGTFENGVTNPDSFKIIVPKGIGHYSVKSAQRWLGCGNNLIEVQTIEYRYDLGALKEALKTHKGNVMALVAYAGDSRTMSVDHLDEIATLTRSIDPDIWLHADACHGFSLGFSKSLRHKIKGIELFDSISTDPHKVMLIPYTLSALLVKNQNNFKKITSLSDLIMQEQYAFGQITPFIGSKPWMSLKLWFMMKNFGWDGLDELITQRHELAKKFAELVHQKKSLKLINDVDINSVAFLYVGDGEREINLLNQLNKKIHSRMLSEGEYHLHQFSIPDPGVFKKDEIIYPLRFMCGNPNTRIDDLVQVLDYVESLGQEEEKKLC